IQQTEHTDPLWIPYAFSGMPLFATMIFPHDVNYVENILSFPGRLLFLNSDLYWFILHFFLNGVFMYALARQLKFSHLASLVAAIVMMMNPDAIGLGEVGHGGKLITLSYLPLLFLCTYNLFQKRDLLSIGLLSAVTGTLLLSHHPQIAF